MDSCTIFGSCFSGGKGIRGPLRNAILADAVDPKHRGKAFGFHRAGDTVGAILGPLLGFALISWWLPASWFTSGDEPYRVVFLLTLIPGLGAASENTDDAPVSLILVLNWIEELKPVRSDQGWRSVGR